MSDEPIPMLDVVGQNEPLMARLEEAASRVIRSGRYILGPEVESFEAEIADFIGVQHSIGVSSGTDALLVALMALDIGRGDEVITTPFTFFATGGCIARVGARPVFVDIDPETFNLDPSKLVDAVTPKTRAVVPVHLFGQSADMTEIRSFCSDRGLYVIEDAAQAVGAKHPSGPIGGIGHYGCFSFFPSKNLGGFGDGGLVTTNDAELADKARVMRVHGSKPKYFHAVVGGNFRLDALQASLLRVKLRELPGWTLRRRANADLYTELFQAAGLDAATLTTPVRRYQGHIYNQYVLRTSQRDGLKDHLMSKKIATAIYYPLSLHHQGCFANLGYEEGSLPESERASKEVLALPIFAGLGEARVRRIANEVIEFLRR